MTIRMQLFSVGIFLSLISVETCAQETQANERAVMAVEVVQPQYRTQTQHLRSDGTVEAKAYAAVNARLAGVTVESFYADVGDWVTQGQLLARLDCAMVKNDLAQAKAARAQTQASLKKANNDVARTVGLSKVNAVSRQEHDGFVATQAIAKAALEDSEVQVAQQQLREGYCEVRAPVGGIVSERPAILGETTQIGSALFRLIQDGQLEWRTGVDPQWLRQIQPGSAAQLLLKGGETVAGTVDKISPLADSATRRVTVYVLLENNPLIHAGRLERGEFLFAETQVLSVPASAVVWEDGYSYLMQVGIDKRIARVRVDLGERDGDWVNVTSPLDETLTVVRSGGNFLNSGDVVQVVP